MEPTKSKAKGREVSVNHGELPVEKRLARAKNRVAALTSKLERLAKRKSSRTVSEAIPATKKAIEDWTRKMKLAQFEYDLGESK